MVHYTPHIPHMTRRLTAACGQVVRKRRPRSRAPFWVHDGNHSPEATNSLTSDPAAVNCAACARIARPARVAQQDFEGAIAGHIMRIAAITERLSQEEDPGSALDRIESIERLSQEEDPDSVLDRIEAVVFGHDKSDDIDEKI